ncbi:hypothetical protein [Mycoplasma sp. CSL7503-lung]|uniref:hypothetical protein n=1 Tax=Mycoplasma sp. CSL7503-lung TaxID=536372 RepID=UPI0021D128B7|nr:hypothetical protein [Mycoplasma sp. CSL7503-lung]MCU4707004.1 hypothetical protein [Mycoplasma sp. CSL7503-lung]
MIKFKKYLFVGLTMLPATVAVVSCSKTEQKSETTNEKTDVNTKQDTPKVGEDKKTSEEKRVRYNATWTS